MPKVRIHDPSEWFTAAQASRLSGVSRAMLNYLCREEVIEPSCDCPRGHGIPRHYSFGDVVALRLVARLSKVGVSTLRLSKGLQYFKQYQLGITLSALPASHIVTDGQHIYLRSGNDVLERATDGQYAFAFVVELDQLRQEVVEKMTATQLKVAAA